MSENFPISDLLRRKLQTSLIIVSLTLSVAATLFLLLFGEKMGFGILQVTEERLTTSFALVFSSFLMFIEILVFIVGAVIISFMVYMTVSQRTKDIGLMKAAGCPNGLIFGYFMTELLIIAFVGCFLGVVLGILLDFASNNLFTSINFQLAQKPLDFWLILSIFALYFAITLIVGAKPILDATKIEAAKAISPWHYIGLSKELGLKTLSNSALTAKIALRSLYRRKSATLRIIVCLTAVFILTTVAVAGGIIANQTTKNWIEKAIGQDIIVIGHQEMCNQYQQLLSKFYETTQNQTLNYTVEKYQISETLIDKLHSLNISDIDARLILEEQVWEVQGYVIDQENGTISSVGDSRTSTSIIVGVEPEKVLNDWFKDGQFLNKSQQWEAMIGDSLSQEMFTEALDQSILLNNSVFDVVGVCFDPVNNGKVVYVPLDNLEKITGISEPNILMIRIDSSVNRTEALNQIRAEIKEVDPEFEAFELNEFLDRDLDFLNYIWTMVMLLPLFSLIATSLCLIGYVILALVEQRQELGVLRALGAKPRTVVTIISVQSLIVLFSSFVLGISLGIILTLLILIPNPVITTYTILDISGWLLAALALVFASSLYPTIKFARKSLLETMTQS